MKNIFTSLIIIASLLVSCESSTCCSKNDEPCEKSKSKKTCSSQEKNPTNNQAFEQNLAAFNSCKDNNVGKGSCKEYLAKAICEYYGIDDFKEGSNYIAYDKIPKKLKELGSWENIGELDEENILLALDRLNNSGKPVLIYNKDDSYVHIVALKPNGTLFKSGKWGNISVPSCISYFPKRKDPHEKG
jgi:hypothetical protein